METEAPRHDDEVGFEPSAPAETTNEHASLVNNDANDPEAAGSSSSEVQVRVTPMRWYILMLFSLLGIYQVKNAII